MTQIPKVFRNMKLPGHKSLAATLLAASLALSACDSAEERAEQHYQSGLTYVAAGEIDKALIEFRNVFKLDGEHLEARLEYARLLTERQDIDQATSQYLRVLEQDPANRTARLAVAQAMIQFQDFEAAEEHAAHVLALDPTDIEALSIRATAYMRMRRQPEAVLIARGILANDPKNVAANLVIVADYLNADLLDEALAQATKSVEMAPDNMATYLVKLAVLEKMKRNDDITSFLKLMAAQFPENQDITRTQVGWMLETGDAKGAESLLREISAKDPDNVAAALDVVGLLERESGLDAAHAELQALAEKSGPNQNSFRRALATMMFRRGDNVQAIQQIESLLEAPIDDNDRIESSVLLAFLQYENGAKDAALAIAEDVLSTDASNVDALKVQAQINIDRDNYEDAISDLRKAQDADPTDAMVLVLQATAHRLNGSPELARERMAAAVAVSGAQPSIAIEYAALLTEDGKFAIAESVLTESTQRHPDDRDALIALAQTQLSQQNWVGAESTAQQIRDLAANKQDPEADRISVAVLQGQNKIEESVGLLQSMLGTGTAAQQEMTMLNIVQTHLETGQTDIAEKFLSEFLAKNPDDYTANLLLGGIYLVTDRHTLAEPVYAKVIANHPNFPGGYIMQSRLLLSQGKQQESAAILDAGIKNSQDTAQLQFMLAGTMELKGDFEGAIAVYSQLYAQTPGSDLLANNLASLLSEHRSDPESMEKAFNVSKRLRDSDFAPYQDTYGWVQYLRGDYEKALATLTKAQAELGENPVFLFHLGMTNAKLGQKENATALLEQALAIADQVNLILPQMDIARTELAALKATTQ